MNHKLALKLIFALSLFGVVFSGTLTYKEIFASTAISCPSPGAPGTILGYPACVYGFVMYLIILTISILGLAGSRSIEN